MQISLKFDKSDWCFTYRPTSICNRTSSNSS